MIDSESQVQMANGLLWQLPPGVRIFGEMVANPVWGQGLQAANNRRRHQIGEAEGRDMYV